MGRNEDRVGLDEAAKLLGVSTRQVRYMVRQGRILPVPGDALLFRLEDVNALLELRLRRMDLPATTGLAMQAHCLSRSTSDRLDKLYRFLGLENNRLLYDEDHVVALYFKAKDVLEEDLSKLENEAVLEWATTFNAIDESYLRMVEQHTFNETPWEPYLSLAHAIMEQRAGNESSNANFAYACLDSGRRHLRFVAYFFVRNKNGAKVADASFEEGADEEVIAQLYPG